MDKTDGPTRQNDIHEIYNPSLAFHLSSNLQSPIDHTEGREREHFEQQSHSECKPYTNDELDTQTNIKSTRHFR